MEILIRIMNTHCGVCYEDSNNKLSCCKQLLCTICFKQLNKCPFCRQTKAFKRRLIPRDETARRWMAPHEKESDYTFEERQLLNNLFLNDTAKFVRTLSTIRGYPF